MEATASPTLYQTGYQLHASWPHRANQEWDTIVELLNQAPTYSISMVPLASLYAAVVSATADGGALLVNSVAGAQHLSAYRYLRRAYSLEGRPTALPLGPARIVDSTIEEIRDEIRQPHLDAIQWMKQVTGFSQERIAELLGVTRQTLNRWQRREPIKDINRQRIFAVRAVLERALTRHRTRAELVEWLDTPRGGDGRTPAQCLAAGDIDRARLLAVSTPSSHLKHAPSWVRRPVPPAFLAGAEHEQEALPPEPSDELERDAPATDERVGER